MAKSSAKNKAEKLSFQAEVSRLLHIVAHSLYSEREIFLRELISNASDACDRLRYEALTKPKLAKGDSNLHIDISIDKQSGSITIADNGIGMNRKDLIENLGTIARSGTAAILDKIASDKTKKKKDKDGMSLIGQFGVGFYSAFMVAEEVTVVSKKAGAASAFQWQSDGNGEFTLSEAERDGRGTSVTLRIKEDAKEFMEPERLRHIIKTYSDHIPVPINLVEGETSSRVNDASALWTRTRSQIKKDQYKEFYHHVAHANDDPWATLHFRAEGVIEYSGLLFIPTARPFNIFHPDRKNQVKLYVKRVFITDDCEELLPSWLRFLRGVVDSEDLDLNVSREMLQNNPIVAKIKKGIVTRVLNELKKRATKEPDSYAGFWDAFGPLMKEGLYESFENRSDLLALFRCHSTHGEGLVSLADYIQRMKKGQDAIYYITGENKETLKKSPQIEGFQSRDVEVLLLSDPIDDFWVPSIGKYEETPFKSVTQGGADLSDIKPASSQKKKSPAKKDSPSTSEGIERLITALKEIYGESVSDVRTSERLTASAVCLVAEEGSLDMNLERLLQQHQQLDKKTSRILELNPDHELIETLAKTAKKKNGNDHIADAALLLLDQAHIMEGEAVTDPVAFARRMETFVKKGLQ